MSKGCVEVVALGDGSPFRGLDGESPAAAKVSAMGFCGFGLVDTDEHIVVRGKVARVFEPDGPEEASIGAKDIVAAGAISEAETCLGPGVSA